MRPPSSSRRPRACACAWRATCLLALFFARGAGGTAAPRARLVKVSHRRILSSGAGASETTWALAMRSTEMRPELDDAGPGHDNVDRVACGRGSTQLPFYSCREIRRAKRAQYPSSTQGPTGLLRGAGWPCADRFGYGRQSTRHFLEGFVLLPNASIASALYSGQLRCLSDRMVVDSRVYHARVYTSFANLTQMKRLLVQSTCVEDKIQTTTNASLQNTQRRRANPIPALSLLELSHGELMSMLPGMKEILNPVVDGVMQPVVNVVASQLGPDLNAPLCEDMAHGINEELPGDVAAMLEQTLTANLTNMLTDSVTMLLSDSLTDSLTKALGPYLDESITEAAHPRLHTAMHNILSHTVPNRLNRDVPTLLIRSLKIGLTQTLTRSVTHSVVPALATALAHTNKQDVFCYMCYTYHLHCRLCHYSPQASYYNQYYSGYYSDYCELFGKLFFVCCCCNVLYSFV